MQGCLAGRHRLHSAAVRAGLVGHAFVHQWLQRRPGLHVAVPLLLVSGSALRGLESKGVNGPLVCTTARRRVLGESDAQRSMAVSTVTCVPFAPPYASIRAPVMFLPEKTMGISLHL